MNRIRSYTYTLSVITLICLCCSSLQSQNATTLKNYYWGEGGYSYYILDKNVIHTHSDEDHDLFHTSYNGDIVAINSNNFVTFIVDPMWSRIIYGNYCANWIKSFGEYGDGNGNFRHPRAICADGLGNLYVADSHGGRIVSLDFSTSSQEILASSFTPLGTSVLELPWDLDVDDRGDTSVSNDRLWVIDKSLNKVLKFNLSGQHLLSITSLHNPSTGATYSDLSGLSGATVRKNPGNGCNSTSNARLYFIDWKLRKLFLVGADDISGGQATIYRETDTFPGSYLLTDVESDFFGDVWIVNETGNSIEKYTWDLKYLDSQGGLNRPTSVASSRRHDKYMAITERWTETTGSRTYTHGAKARDLYINPGTHVMYSEFVTTNYGRVVVKFYQGATLVPPVRDGIAPSGHQSHPLYQQNPQGEYTMKVWAYSYNDSTVYDSLEQDFEFLPEWPADLALSDMTIWGEQVYTVTNSITAGPNFTIEDGADVLMRAKNTITLLPGFTAKEGSEFNAYIYTGSIPKAIPADAVAIGEDGAQDNSGNNTEPTPTKYNLSHNYPNPFNPVTTIRFGLPDPARTQLVVYNLLGREVIRLVDEHREPGYYQVVWQGRDAAGREIPSGIYIARLVTPEYTKSIKMLLLK